MQRRGRMFGPKAPGEPPARSPATHPVCGDFFEAADGERRSVEVSRRDALWTVRYRRSLPDFSATARDTVFECSVAEWRTWAQSAQILHAAHKAFKPCR